ncbi:zinc ribbon domain-containing protein [Chloroflexus sp.]|uniref:zinc ribbon domain-containing protein n=1 Tax=Chloroflexus sp. TaxID=1904827 RepID=UPI00298EE5CF|nr:zinc ribbon domain-containing protein [Chloroflexus sp.]MCS6889355.1 zinc ribbon domain-containing protein [Chloroflexus sp.]MDW8402969.1 zinc ribbon domain-containing protein [Chloroflexus sp.]
MHCPHCNTIIPDDARFCIECGTAVRVATGETVQLPSNGAATIACPRCNFANPRHARFCVYCGEPVQAGGQARAMPTPSPTPARDTSELGITLLLIGAALLIPIIFRLPPMIWPNILMVLGIAQLIFHFRRGTLAAGMRNAIWLFGLGVLFLIPRLFFPGLLVLVGLTLLLESWRWTQKTP